jgi:hypothetical protein
LRTKQSNRWVFVEAHGWRGMGKDDVADMLFENRVQLIDSIAEVKKNRY